MSRPRSGRTLIEVLVVVAVVAILLGLVLVAVQKVRQRAARLQDENNLRQVATAAHGYHAQHSRLPPFAAVLPGASYKPFDLVPGPAWLLPHLDEPSLDALYRPSPRPGYSDYRAAFDHVAKPYVSTLDPSHTGGRVEYVWRPSVHPHSGVANYVLNVRLLGTQSSDCGPNDRRTTLLNGIPDGSSNTLLLATRRGMCGDGGSVWNGGHLPGYCGSQVVGGFFGHVVADGPAFQVTPSEAECDPNRPQAFTSAGLTAGMADGSVRTVRPGLDPAVWRVGLLPDDGAGLPPD